jgi:glycosyltransferase involved in cell wall biosynthesis
MLVRAAALARCRLPLRIVGDGPDRHRLEALARLLEVDVAIQPEQDPAAIARLLSDAVYVHAPSRIGEGFPTSILEALAVGCPVLAPAFPARTDYLSDATEPAFASAEELAALIDAFAEQPHRVRTVAIPSWDAVYGVVAALAMRGAKPC